MLQRGLQDHHVTALYLDNYMMYTGDYDASGLYTHTFAAEKKTTVLSAVTWRRILPLTLTLHLRTFYELHGTSRSSAEEAYHQD